MRTTFSLTFLLLLFLLFNGSAAAQHAIEGEIAPDFTVTTMKGDTITLSKLRGKIVVLNFWFINCPPCREEMAGLNDLVAMYGDSGVVFIAPATDRKGALTKFLAKSRFDYQIIPSARGLTSLYQLEGFPTHVIIGRDGKIVKRMLGGGSIVPLMLRPIIASLVDEAVSGDSR
jgi:peroxiredoxin